MASDCRDAFSVPEATHEQFPSVPLTPKRILDLALCIVFLPIVLFLSLIIALAVVLETGRPVLFVQPRVGKHKKRFRILKFRTLRHEFDDLQTRQQVRSFVRGEIALDAGDGHPQIRKPIRPNQITRVGHVLRNTGLDELPQLWNILCGEMSWVGPRPHVESEVEVYADWHHKRFAVLPGITGLAQVRGARLRTFDEMVQSDLEYIQNQSLFLDLKVIVSTMLWIFFRRVAQ